MERASSGGSRVTCAPGRRRRSVGSQSATAVGSWAPSCNWWSRGSDRPYGTGNWGHDPDRAPTSRGRSAPPRARRWLRGGPCPWSQVGGSFGGTPRFICCPLIRLVQAPSGSSLIVGIELRLEGSHRGCFFLAQKYDQIVRKKIHHLIHQETVHQQLETLLQRSGFVPIVEAATLVAEERRWLRRNDAAVSVLVGFPLRKSSRS